MGYLFSIIIPIYNTEFLERSIKGVIGQKLRFSNIQLILVNAGNQEEAEEICKTYQEQYPDNICYIEMADKNISAVRNAGIEAATGEFTGFLDSGDVFSKNTCSAVYAYFKVARELVDVAVIPIHNFDAVEGPHYLNKKFEAGTRTLDLVDAKWFDACTRVSQAFIRTEILKKYKFDESLLYYSETKLMTEVLLEKKRVGLVSRAKYYQRRYTTEKGPTAVAVEDENAREFYLGIPKKISMYYLEMAEKEDVSAYLRNLILSELKWRIFFKMTPVKEQLTAEEYEEYKVLNREVLSKIPDSIIFEGDIFHFWQKVYLMNMKYERNILDEATYDEEGKLIWKGYELYDLQNNLQANLLDIDIVDHKLYVKGYLSGLLIGDVAVYAQTDENYEKATIQKDVVSTTMFPLEDCAYKYTTFEVSIPLPEEKADVCFLWEIAGKKWMIKKTGISLSGVAEHVRPVTQEKEGYRITRLAKGIEVEQIQLEKPVEEEPNNNRIEIGEESNVEIYREDALVVDNVSIKFNLSPEKVDNLKEYVIKTLKGQIRYEEYWALQDVSFTLKKGERLGILGLNGSGKSTLLKVIAGVYKPTTGSVKRNGLILPMLELGAGFAMDYTGKENVFLYGSVLGYNRAFMSEHYDEIVEFSELGQFMDVPLKNYSSGMRARLGFAIATVVKPEILILDEVLSVGDAKFKKKSEDKMLELIEGGTTVLFVSHSLAQVKKICDKAMILSKGKMLAFGDIDEVSVEYERITEE